MAFAQTPLCLCVRVLCRLLMATLTVSCYVTVASALTSLMNLKPSRGNQIQDNTIWDDNAPWSSRHGSSSSTRGGPVFADFDGRDYKHSLQTAKGNILVSTTLKCFGSLRSRVIVISNATLLLTVNCQSFLLAMRKTTGKYYGIWDMWGETNLRLGHQSTLQTDPS